MAHGSPYDNAASVTSQVFFCAAPIRLDAYNGCEFACTYCFSRRRSRLWADSGIKQASHRAFANRLDRVAAGQVGSALDEFLRQRVPIQLGGLHDPFSERERTEGVTLKLLEALKKHDYPTLISTKGDIVAEEPYVSLLQEMNVLVRFSAAGVSELIRSQIDRNCPNFETTLKSILTLSSRGIATALRVQPVFPGYELDALRMTRAAALAGAVQVSFEYIKLPNELSEREISRMSEALGYDLKERMNSLGRSSLGRDYSLCPAAKKPFVRRAKDTCHELGIRFGAGDTEFIPWSDGAGCCGSSDLLPRSPYHFTANLTGVIKKARKAKRKTLRFSDLENEWAPQMSVGNYLASRTRRSVSPEDQLSDWLGLLAARWNGGNSPYSPDFFDGVVFSGKYDRRGYKIFRLSHSIDDSIIQRPSAQDAP